VNFGRIVWKNGAQMIGPHFSEKNALNIKKFRPTPKYIAQI
jgi:hypothetical protein